MQHVGAPKILIPSKNFRQHEHQQAVCESFYIHIRGFSCQGKLQWRLWRGAEKEETELLASIVQLDPLSLQVC